MISSPSLKTKAVTNDNYDWRPASFKDFLEELKHIRDSLREAFFYRGHRQIDWLLDSTFSRSLKRMLRLLIKDRKNKRGWRNRIVSRVPLLK